MKNIHFSFEDFAHCFLAVLSVGFTTGIMALIGRSTLGEAVIALLFLVPIGFSTTRWGQIPGICAAVSAALAFDFFFIPPFYTFNVGSMEGWLVLVIFLGVAVLIVGRIQYGLSQAREHEREAIFMYELSSSLAGLQDPQAIARLMSEQLQRLFQARLVQVCIDSGGSSQTFSAPDGVSVQGAPDRVLPILATKDLQGEVCIWAGKLLLPPENNRLLQSYAIQGALALERANRIPVTSNQYPVNSIQ